jgi:hypothetical protein
MDQKVAKDIKFRTKCKRPLVVQSTIRAVDNAFRTGLATLRRTQICQSQPIWQSRVPEAVTRRSHI